MAMRIEELQSYNKENTQKTGIANYVTEEQFAALESMMVFKKVKKGAYLFWEGDVADRLYYIRSGQVKLLKSTEEGKDLILSIQQKGDLIAEMGGFQDSTHSYSGRVMADAEIGVIYTKDLASLFGNHGGMSLPFMYWLGLTQRIMQSKFRDLLLYGKPGALASTLIRLANTYGVAKPSGTIHVKLKLTNSEFGDMIGATRESVNRMLSEWKDNGTLDFIDGKLVIYRLEDLRAICNCPNGGAGCPLEMCRL
ncbi:Crp/Fnr family transcriptional regulator [Paenibacillus sp. TRM 82003]|nr:Crp/Fnr family transcriptional regulator [Paenibacillus sp. TRM 82003]